MSVETSLAKLDKKAKAALDENLQSGEAVQVVVLGENKQSLVATDRRAFVFKKGISSGSFFGKQFNSWDFRNVSGVELKRGMTIQALVLQVPGVAPVTQVGRMSKGPNSAWEAPNAIMCPGKLDLNQTVSSLRELIAKHQQPYTPAAGPAPLDSIDQVKRLAELRDQGILSEEEFQQKKCDLLGL